MKNILLLNTDLPYGGGAMMIVWLANKLAENGFYVTFVTYRKADKNYLNFHQSIRHIDLGTETEGHILKEMFQTVKSLRKVIKSNKYDLGIAFLSPSQLRLGIAAKGTKTKVLLSHRADPFLKRKNTSIAGRILGQVSSYLFNHADGYAFQTTMARDYFSDAIKKRSSIIPNPVRALSRTEDRKAESVEKRIVNVARLDIFQKRQDVLIEAFKIVSKTHPNYTLELYGDGEDEALLKGMASGYDNIIFKGVTTDVVKSIQHAAISVLSSDFEGIPNVVLEAMSLGVPCISTDCSPGGTSMLIDSGKNGLIVPCGESEELAKAINKFIENPMFAEDCGLQGTEVKERFSEEKIVKMWIALINRILC